jgi:hypothetical protein
MEKADCGAGDLRNSGIAVTALATGGSHIFGPNPRRGDGDDRSRPACRWDWRRHLAQRRRARWHSGLDRRPQSFAVLGRSRIDD